MSENEKDDIQKAIDDVELSEVNINLTFTLNRNDIFWYNLFYARFLVIGVIVFLILMVVGLIVTVNTPKGDLRTTLYWIELALGIGFSICLATISAIALQVYIVKNKTIEKAITKKSYIINSAGIAIFDERRKLTRTWKDIVKIDRSRQRFYIRTSSKLAIIIPYREFNNPEERLLFERLAKRDI